MKTQKDDLALAHLSLKKPYYAPGPFLWLVRRTGQALPQSPVSNLGQHSTSFSESSWSGALEIGFRHTAAPSANPEGLAPGADYSAAPEARSGAPQRELCTRHRCVLCTPWLTFMALSVSCPAIGCWQPGLPEVRTSPWASWWWRVKFRELGLALRVSVSGAVRRLDVPRHCVLRRCTPGIR